MTCNNYTMVFPPIRIDNPRALANGLSLHPLCNFYIEFISIELAQFEIFVAKVCDFGHG